MIYFSTTAPSYPPLLKVKDYVFQTVCQNQRNVFILYLNQYVIICNHTILNSDILLFLQERKSDF